jgi:hypothetical protein
MLKPIIRGWLTYYRRYYKSALYPTLPYLDRRLARWAMATTMSVATSAQGRTMGEQGCLAPRENLCPLATVASWVPAGVPMSLERVNRDAISQR